ncbi:hypothetical protein HNR01_001359 [Methylorubrum rhodesianum]|jgi:hypothetical protein|nr:hypothetical protein [Methylorubrum rhodesianum]
MTLTWPYFPHPGWIPGTAPRPGMTGRGPDAIVRKSFQVLAWVMNFVTRYASIASAPPSLP